MQNKYKMLYIDFMLLLVAAVWGANPAVVKLGLAYMSPMAFNEVRMIFAGIVSWIILLVSGTHIVVERNDWLKMTTAGIFGFFIFQIAYTLGVSYTTAGNASFILALGPISAAVINWVLKTEKITLRMLFGILISITGVAVIITASGRQVSFAGTELKGAVLMFAAQFTFAVFTVSSGSLVKKYSNYQVVTYSITMACMLFAIPSAKDMTEVNWLALPAAGWISLLFSGILSVCLANFLWAWGVKLLGSTKTSLYNNLPPIFAVVTGYFLLGETFGWKQVLGAVLAFTGLYVTRTGKELLAAPGKNN